MTKATMERGTRERGRCAHCRRVLPAPTGPGRPRRYCSGRCRQSAWVSRQRASELALSEHELIVTREELDRLQDDLYVLACAVADVEHDLADSKPTVATLRTSLAWLIESAAPLVDRTLRP